MTRKEFQDALLSIMDRENYTIRDVAHKCAFSTPTVKRWLRGDNAPARHTRTALLRHLDINMWREYGKEKLRELFGDETEFAYADEEAVKCPHCEEVIKPVRCWTYVCTSLSLSEATDIMVKFDNWWYCNSSEEAAELYNWDLRFM